MKQVSAKPEGKHSQYKEKKYDILKVSNLEGYNSTIQGYPALILETMHLDHPTYERLLKILSENDNIHIYNLRHSEMDWSIPKYLEANSVLVNFFGYAIVYGNVKLSRKYKDSLMLTSRNLDIDWDYDDMHLIDWLRSVTLTGFVA
jgi:hypothetical protein